MAYAFLMEVICDATNCEYNDSLHCTRKTLHMFQDDEVVCEDYEKKYRGANDA